LNVEIAADCLSAELRAADIGRAAVALQRMSEQGRLRDLPGDPAPVVEQPMTLDRLHARLAALFDPDPIPVDDLAGVLD